MRNKSILTYLLPVLIVSGFLFFPGCSPDRFANIKTTDIEIEVVRFEEELFKLNLYDFKNESYKLTSQHPEFMGLFGNKVIEIGDPSQHWFTDGLQAFSTDQAIFNMYQKVTATFPNMHSYEEELKSAFGKWTTVFPEKSTPKIYTYISGFNQSIVTSDKLLGISLEKYLGADEELYNQVYPPIPAYQRYVMSPDKIPSDIIRAWSMTEIEYLPEKDNLLSQMIYNGQIMYLTSKLLPNTPDSVLWSFKPEQLEFCKNNEKQMWTYLIEQKLLFNTDNFRIAQFIEERPFTKDFTNESPGRAAVWLGYRIVDNYARNNSNLELSEIITENNYQKVLNKSKYRP